jgi:hypothetical protein
VRIDETIDAIELYYTQGRTDGLPVAPPPRTKVQAMVKRSGRAASEVIAELPPQGGQGDRGTHCHERRDGRVFGGEACRCCGGTYY